MSARTSAARNQRPTFCSDNHCIDQRSPSGTSANNDFTNILEPEGPCARRTPPVSRTTTTAHGLPCRPPQPLRPTRPCCTEPCAPPQNKLATAAISSGNRYSRYGHSVSQSLPSASGTAAARSISLMRSYTVLPPTMRQSSSYNAATVSSAQSFDNTSSGGFSLRIARPNHPRTTQPPGAERLWRRSDEFGAMYEEH